LVNPLFGAQAIQAYLMADILTGKALLLYLFEIIGLFTASS